MKTVSSILITIVLLVNTVAPVTYEYIGNKNTKKFHETICWTLPKEENRVYFEDREDAIEENYSPCKNCNP